MYQFINLCCLNLKQAYLLRFIVLFFTELRLKSFHSNQLMEKKLKTVNSITINSWISWKKTAPKVQRLFYKLIVFEKLLLKIWATINPYQTTGLFQCPLKTSENIWFSDVLGSYWKRSVVWDNLIMANLSLFKVWTVSLE